MKTLAVVAVWMPIERSVLIMGSDDLQVVIGEAEAEALAGAIGGALAVRDHAAGLSRLDEAGFSGEEGMMA